MGVAGAFGISLMLRNRLAAFDPMAYGIAVAVIASAALLASWLPSLRATRIAPSRSLQ